MNSLVRKIDQIGLVMRPLDELNGISGEQVRNVPAGTDVFAVFIYLRINVRPLSFKTYSSIKSRTLGVVVPHVPLPYECRCVTGSLQQ